MQGSRQGRLTRFPRSSEVNHFQVLDAQEKAVAHAGAWKVAYADFVTGMMSLFLVLWILSQDEEVIIATTRFFRDPYKAGVPKSTPVEQKDARPGSMVDQIVGRSDTTMRNTDDTTSIDIDVLHRIAQDWYKRLRLHEIDDETIQIEATTDGIKVTLFYGDEKPMFEKASNALTNHGKKVMQRMAWLLSQHALVFALILTPIISPLIGAILLKSKPRTSLNCRVVSERVVRLSGTGFVKK